MRIKPALLSFGIACVLVTQALAQPPSPAGTVAAASEPSPARAPVAAALEELERPAERFNRAILMERARALASRPYVSKELPPNRDLEIGYDQYRSIRLETGAGIWSGQGRNFTLELFYPGFLYRMPVEINLVVGGQAREVFFTDEVFDFGDHVRPPVNTVGKSYSGFRIHAPINTPERYEEFLVFQGASYFRGVGREQFYGLSARGLALRTARPEGEEFPYFTRFWIERPPEAAQKIVVHALLESPSVVGAYTFDVVPGEETVMDVQAAIYARNGVEAYGVAPLTSMFLFDASSPRPFDDFRAAVHDSDGLQILTGTGEQIWRPLANPRDLQVSAFLDRDPRGFGLLQRKRAFAQYQDADARYDKRPSLWVEPLGKWGEGHVELVEIPTDREIHDNIVAYWSPRAALVPGQPLELAYRLRWGREPLGDTLARTVGTRTGRSLDKPERRAYVVDFAPTAGAVPADAEDLKFQVTSSAGQVYFPRIAYVEAANVFRGAFEIDLDGEDVVELRGVVTRAEKPWSETWLYRWTR